jgi:16S rRNA (cytidine1402-2'-O)-methyltransferase
VTAPGASGPPGGSSGGPSGGALILVGTPIGNLGDLAPRAVEALASADVVCCEDTRRTGRLLQHAGIDRPPLVVVNDHTEAREVGRVLARLDRGERVAVVSDAGMPGVSDPGERLVAAAANAGHTVEVVPGPSAALAALVVSGLPTGRFVFEGFLPRKGSGRTERLAVLAAERRTAVVYEAPHRVARTLADLVESCGGGRRVAVVRELTKLHEEVWRGTLAAAVEWTAGREPRGEIVLVLDGAPEAPPPGDDDLAAALRAELAAGTSARDAAALVAVRFGVPRRRAYELAVSVGKASKLGS